MSCFKISLNAARINFSWKFFTKTFTEYFMPLCAVNHNIDIKAPYPYFKEKLMLAAFYEILKHDIHTDGSDIKCRPS